MLQLFHRLQLKIFETSSKLPKTGDSYSSKLCVFGGKFFDKKNCFVALHFT